MFRALMLNAISETVPLEDEPVDLRALSLKFAGLHQDDVLKLRVSHAATLTFASRAAPQDLIHSFMCCVQSRS